ncbi:MAG: SIMPL domain-containing protein [Gemmatimonadaceae bacterium]
MPATRDLAGAGILAVGLAVGGLFVGSGFARMRTSDRYVTVKGISEREVKADLAIWPLHLVVADNDLTKAHAQIESSVARIRTFLGSFQIDTSQIILQDFSVTDAAANQYSGERAGSRYVIKQTKRFFSSRVEIENILGDTISI